MMHDKSSSHQLAFFDGTASDVRSLADQVPDHIEPIIIEFGTDPLEVIAQVLASRADVGAVHIFGHGSPGNLVLGGITLDAEVLPHYADVLASIGFALSGGDILLYGCSVGEGSKGAKFVDLLARLTAANVAAADGPIGAAVEGGSWKLPVVTGALSTAVIEMPQFVGILASGILQNRYVKFGYSDDGTLGVDGGAKPGIQYDPTGNREFFDSADSLTPGSPFEGFSVKVGTTLYSENNDNGAGADHGTSILGINQTTEGVDTFGSVTFVTLAGGLRIEQTYSLTNVDSKVITMAVTVENVSGETVSAVSYARYTDPDVDSNDLPGATSSTNNTIGAEGIDAEDIVLATGPTSGRVIGLYSNSSFDHATGVSDDWSSDPADYLSGVNTGPASDAVIGIGFDLGDFAVGESKSFSFAYVFAASAAELDDSISEVPPATNTAPVFTEISGPVDTVFADQQGEISYADIAAQADESDSGGSVEAFVVTGVTSGTLLIGESSETAMAWAAGTNDRISSTLNAYWTPQANTSGTRDAFTVVAVDNEGALSTTEVQVPVSVIHRLVGTVFNDLLVDDSGLDTLILGLAGDDILVGGIGNDTLDGSDGNDTADYGSASASVTVDLAQTGAQAVSAEEGSDTLINIENLAGSGFADTLLGNAGSNVLTGRFGADVLDGDAGNDRLYGNQGADLLKGGDGDDWLHGGQQDDLLFGGFGDDTLAGGKGDDLLVGDEGSDTAEYLTAEDGVSVSLSILGAQRVSASEGTDTLVHIENLTGGLFGDSLTGDAGTNVLMGDKGDDVLKGLAGSDSLFGGLGNDTLSGGMGDDLLNGGEGSDLADYGTAEDGVSVNLSIEGAQSVSPLEGTDTLISIENLTGSHFNDALTGNAAANSLIGGDGADVLTGLFGNDMLRGGLGNDTLYGNQGDDLLEGGEGNNWMHGGQGNDRLIGRAGDDTLAGGKGNDFLTGGAGSNTAEYLTAEDGVSVNLSIVGAQRVSASEGTDTLVDIANLTGSRYGDSLTGNAAANTLLGADGNDVINGLAGNDVLEGGAGNDRLYGNQDNDLLEGEAGDDWLHGGQGTDALFGGLGRDTLAGGKGDDILAGGDGADVFVFEQDDGSGGTDYIFDFEQGVDQIGLTGRLAAMVSDGDDDIIMQQLIWNATNSTLSLARDGNDADLIQLATIVHDGSLILTSEDFTFV